MLCMVSYSRRPQSGQITCYLNRTYHVLPTVVMLCIALSAICIYGPCRWNYRRIPPPTDVNVRQDLPYLYLVFFSSLPFLLYKNYLYFRYIQEHGGYIVFFSDYGHLAASFPLVVRAVALLTLPVLVAIVVFEKRTERLYLSLIHISEPTRRTPISYAV